MKARKKAKPSPKRAVKAKRKPAPKKARAPKKPLPLPHDTPPEAPRHHEAPVAAIELSMPPLERAKSASESAVALSKRAETIEAAYEAWAELRAEHQQVTEALKAERQHLEEQGDFLLGAVKQARELTGGTEALVKAGEGLDSVVIEAQQKLSASRSQLLEREAALARAFNRGFSDIKAEVRARLERTLSLVKPKVKLMVRSLAQGQRIVHLGRPSPDEAPVLLWLFTRKIATRYEFLFDDSTDDPTQAPPNFYSDEELRPEEVHGGIAQLRERLSGTRDALPVKGIIPLFLPRASGPASLLRLVERGPVVEVEIADGEGWRNLMTAEEAEAFAGWLIKLKLEGRIELELTR